MTKDVLLTTLSIFCIVNLFCIAVCFRGKVSYRKSLPDQYFFFTTERLKNMKGVLPCSFAQMFYSCYLLSINKTW